METGSSGSTGGGSGNTGTRHDPHLQRKIFNSANSALNDDVFAGHSDKSASLRAPPPPSQTAGSLPHSTRACGPQDVCSCARRS